MSIRQSNSEKELGLELLRLLSMLMIVTLHVLSASGGGGVIRNTEPLSVNYLSVWIMETVSIQAVNCFGLISGYALSKRSWTIKKYIEFWITVFIMNLVIFILTRVLQWHTNSLMWMIKASIPWFSDLWYVKAYLGLLLIIPILNIAIEKWSDIKLLYIVCGIIMMVPIFYHVDYFLVSNGYSTVWLAMLYIFGGGCRNYNECGKKEPSIVSLIFGVILFSSCSFLLKIVPEYIALKHNSIHFEMGEWFVYNSPVVLLQSICLLLLFSRIKTLTPKWFSVVSGAAFGVYVVHKNPIINEKFIYNVSNDYATMPTQEMLIRCMGLIAKVFTLSLMASIPITVFANNLCRCVMLIGENMIEKTGESIRTQRR